MFPARGENVKLGKGSVMLGIYTDGVVNGFDFTGNVQGVAISSEVTSQQLFSSTQASGALVDKSRTQIAYTLTLSGMNEFTIENLKLFLAGTQNPKAQAAGSAVGKTFTNVVVGKYYDIGDRQISAVVVEEGSSPLVAGTDYEVNTEFGIIRFLDGGAIIDGDDPQVTYTRPELTIDQVRIATAGPYTAHLLYLADDANTGNAGAHDRLEVWKVDLAPDGELNLISEDYSGFSLSCAILSDASNHPDDPYGTLDRVRA